MSASILLLTFTGRKSGQTFTTPLRYVRHNDSLRCFSSPEAKWWSNLRGGAKVEVVVEGKREHRIGRLLNVDDDEKLAIFRDYLLKNPGDAAYHGLKPNRRNPQPDEALQAVLPDVVIVELTLP